MFAARFDPNAFLATEEKVESLPSTKRTVSEADLSEDESDESSNNDSDSSSDSDSDSESDDESENVSDDSEVVQIQPEDIEDIEKEQNPIGNEDVEMMDQDKEEQDEEPVEPTQHDSKFSSIISRFNKSITKSANADLSESEEENEDDTQDHELVPIPQPALPKDHKLTRQQLANNLNWLSTPQYISPTSQKSFSEFPLLNPKILENLKLLKFDNAFATQIKTLEILLPEIENRLNPTAIKGDLLVNASTGSGKTLAYIIPIIQSLASRIVPRLRAIILVPTKPLIQQVYKSFISISRGFDLNIVTLGKNDFSLNEEHLKLIKNIPDIVITTPGRLVDHLNLESFILDDLQWCVIDEADRLLNQSFQDWSNILISRLNKLQNNIDITKQFKKKLTKMIFSATLTTDPGKLTTLRFNNPRLIIVNNESSILTSDQIFTLPPTLNESIIKTTSSKSSIKPLLLIKLLKQLNNPSNVLIFTKSNESTLRLSRLLTILTSKLQINTIISNINSQSSPQQRSKTLTAFSQGSINILISTDLIARGIDISTIKHVINYDLPNSSREYVHRVGRTARAGQEGDAYSFVIGQGEFKFWTKFQLDISRDAIIKEIEIENVETFEEKIYEESLKELEKEVYNKA